MNGIVPSAEQRGTDTRHVNYLRRHGKLPVPCVTNNAFFHGSRDARVIYKLIDDVSITEQKRRKTVHHRTIIR